MATWHDDCTDASLWTKLGNEDDLQTQDGYFYLSCGAFPESEKDAYVTRTIDSITGDFELDLSIYLKDVVIAEDYPQAYFYVYLMGETDALGVGAITTCPEVDIDTPGMQFTAIKVELSTFTLIDIGTINDSPGSGDYNGILKLKRVGNVYSFYRSGVLIGQQTISNIVFNQIRLVFHTPYYYGTPPLPAAKLYDIKLSTGGMAQVQCKATNWLLSGKDKKPIIMSRTQTPGT